MADHTTGEKHIPGPEHFQHFSDDLPVKIEMEYEGNTVPFFVILIWLGMIIGVSAYVLILVYPDAIDWWG